MDELIQQAQKLCAGAKAENDYSEPVFGSDTYRLVMECAPQLCDALAAAQEKIVTLNLYVELYQDICQKHMEAFHKMEAIVNELASCTKDTKAELSALRMPKKDG